MRRRCLLLIAGLTLASCTATGGRAATAPSSPATSPPPPAGAKSAPADASLRERWQAMFARGYFQGRSGQIFVVPREGEVITDRDPLYMFMHGSPWEYDTHIPLFFYGAPFVRQSQSPEAVSQQNIAPTVGALIGAPPVATYTGRALPNVMAAGAGKPRIAVVLVLDAMRADYFDRFADAMPTLTRMQREGASFPNAHVTSLPTVTGVGHATIGTGTDPRFHGITVNNLFNTTTNKPQPAYEGLDPRELMTLTLADAWNISTGGRAVIIGQGGAIRATAGLVGHGSCIINGRKVIAASYAGNAGWETNPACYTMSEALKPLNGKTVWDAAGGTWMGHDIASPSKFRASALFQKFEAEALLAVLNESAIGADDITDLVMVNMKGPDYTAHAYGPYSPEIKETLTELDRQVTRLLETLDRKAGGVGRTVVVVSADHGMPPEPAPGHRHYPEDIAALVHQKFDPAGKALIQYYGDAANNQIYIDKARLQTLGHSMKDIAAFLESQEMFAAAFTEDDIWAAQAKLPFR